MSAAPSAGSKPLRLGFAGLGWIGLNRMEAMLERGGVEAAALADASPDALARARERAPSARACASFDDLLALELDGLVIATPSAQHAQQAIAALDAGFAVFCQKPLGRTAVEARAAVDAARRADRLLQVDFSYRFTRAAQIIRDMILRGDIGEVFACDLTFHNAYGPDKDWFYDVAQAGGGCVMDLGVHLVDLALWMAPSARVEQVSSALFKDGARLGPAPTCCEDYALASLRLSTGAQARIACSWRLHAGRDAVICAQFHGANGGVRMRNVNGSFYDFIAERFTGTRTQVLCEPPDAWGGQAAVNWVRMLAASPRFDPAAEEIGAVAQVLDAIYGRRT
ncbi:MAG: Gfo/Idh/MocA family oxidoreductase [Beijerinckiaceae bacterium]|nr:Gfo/Idh/MocA family oxidoreductase [Beijerinckiaceae bacterium]